MTIELTYKRKSKELETALAVVRCLINDSKNCIKSNKDDKDMKNNLKVNYINYMVLNAY